MFQRTEFYISGKTKEHQKFVSDVFKIGFTVLLDHYKSKHLADRTILNPFSEFILVRDSGVFGLFDMELALNRHPDLEFDYFEVYDYVHIEIIHYTAAARKCKIPEGFNLRIYKRILKSQNLNFLQFTF